RRRVLGNSLKTSNAISLPGLTSLNRSGFDAIILYHFDAAELAPSTASKVDISQCNRHVRFTPESGHLQRNNRCPLRAMCGRLRVGKNFFHVCSVGRCGHVFGLLARCSSPLPIMPFADQVPVNSSHSIDALALVGCPDRWIDGVCITCCLPFPTVASRRNRRDLVQAASATGSL